MARRLTTAQHDRAAGVLLGQACGDALGVPYEFARPPGADELAEMKGGGLGDFAPGEWSDDTAMAGAIARVAATGVDLTLPASLDAVADGFLEWHASGPADIGIQTSAVLGATRRRLAGGGRPGSVMREEAARYAARNPRSAGNGALMRTAVVALAHLDDRERLARAARAVAELTHADPLAGDSCVLWCEAVRVAVLDGRLDVRAGLELLPADRREQWTGLLGEAEAGPASRFTPNGFTVTALQAAVAAISLTPVPDGPMSCLHLQDALHAAVRIGDDTDTVAAIAGGLLGARWGASAVPWRWRRAVHGWPGRDGRDLVTNACLAVAGGRADPKGWPVVEDVAYDEPASSRVVPHPFDEGVLLGTHRSRDHGADAVVSMCRVGRDQACFDGADVVVESRLMDSEDPAANPNLAFTLRDAADAVRGLRAEGKVVLLHCVAAQQRTPSVAVEYGVLLGHEVGEVRRAVVGALRSTRGYGLVWDAAGAVL
ncbi:ADP-ribosyl-[dinitrogen reductase] glycohydrolase [Nocardioides aquaticus]|uniref:ADP-ribosyl-[dinitrogen reductase] glycohydrolase n=1 Tax=Nocardioides aquaticus TaxID=160826 RepID=A0ABX8EMH9_9ACTN|nr:ADP-ribosylglycohydrolase family protein [Nocardioides aquaticus]QVT81484.1 ADP-ribosyl-[dinitrogen reductase] glycohydrolase [Nocardioides aquaticus]